MLQFNEGGEGRKTLFANVILPLALPKLYTYRIRNEHVDEVSVGKRVVVQFGKSKLYTAIVHSISETPPEAYDAKYITDVLDDEPIVHPEQLAFWQWIADYYLCTLGEVMQAALPSALKLASETKIILRADITDEQKSELNDKEFLICDALELQPELKVSDISAILGQKTVFPILKSLFDKGIIHISEDITQKYKPRKKAFVVLNELYTDAESRRLLFETLERAPKQLDALMTYLALSRSGTEVAKAALLEASGCGEGALTGLVKKEVFSIEDKIVSRIDISGDDTLIPQQFELNDAQQGVLYQIEEHFSEKDTVLLHGVTSSGKTQVYIRLIEKYLAQGRQVLYLLPEIALTTQVIERLKRYFGDAIGVYHSRFNDNERAEVWQKVLKNEFKLIVGARSAVFLPFADLGLVVVDEEHESSYKQYDPAPRYHARDCSVFMSSLFGSKVLLGSATPSVESYYNAINSKYGLVELPERYGGVQVPDIEVVNITEQSQKKLMQEHFSSTLVEAIQHALDTKKQVILFQNRRGYTPMLICAACGYTPKCINCDVSLTYHKSSAKLHCHYCGYKQSPPAECPACGSAKIEQKGYGTEKIEEDIKMLFPEIRVSRMDYDTTRNRNSFQQIINDFEDQNIQVLVGTQMVAKGLDFGNVSLIGIVNADMILNFPDFRSYERGFQLLVQVAGRAGRREQRGKVLIQTYQPAHPIIKQVQEGNYKELFETELEERRKFKYPPFYRMIQLDIKHKDPERVGVIAMKLAGQLKAAFGERILGPQPPLVARVRNLYIQVILIKVERSGNSIQKVKEALRAILFKAEADKDFKGAVIQPDVDPY